MIAVVRVCVGCSKDWAVLASDTHKACPECRIDVANVALSLMQELEADLRIRYDEALAEIAAYQGKEEGAINEHWTWSDDADRGQWRRDLGNGWVLFANHDSWRVWHYTGISDCIDVNESGDATSFRDAMRFAEVKAVELKLLTSEPK